MLLKPSYNEVGTAAPRGAGALADIAASLPLPHGPTLLDVSITEAAAERGDHVQRRDLNGHKHQGHTFIPASAET